MEAKECWGIISNDGSAYHWDSRFESVSDKAFEIGKQAGIREVVELVDNTDLIEHTDSPLHEIGATILDCPACCWYAYKKERGL